MTSRKPMQAIEFIDLRKVTGFTTEPLRGFRFPGVEQN